jgi:hypothetical protein
MSGVGTDTLIGQLDPNTFERDLQFYEENTHQPVRGVRKIVEEELPHHHGRHVPQPDTAWDPAEFEGMRPSNPNNEIHHEEEQHHHEQQHYYETPPTTNSQSMVNAHLNKSHHATNPHPPEQTFTDMFHAISSNRGASVRFASDPRPTPQAQPVDATYHERQELLAKVDDLRLMGFSVPSAQEIRSMPSEDLRSVIRRRTMTNDTHTLVNSACTVFCGVSKWVELINSLAGGVIPLPNYARDVDTAAKTPRFRLAIYQIILKLGGRVSAGPWMEIVIVMFFPVLQAVISKLVVYFSRGRIPLNAQNLYNGMSMATSRLTESIRPDVNDGGGVVEVSEEEEEEEDEEEEEETVEVPIVEQQVENMPTERSPNNSYLSRPPIRRPGGYIVPG